MTGCKCYIIFTPPVKSFEITQYKSDTYVFSSCPRGNEVGVVRSRIFVMGWFVDEVVVRIGFGDYGM